MLVLATVPVHETSLANQHFYSTLLGRGRRYVKEYSLYACENAENYGWSLTKNPLTNVTIFILDLALLHVIHV